MSSEAITVALIIVLIGVIFASYLRSCRGSDGDSDQAPMASVSDVMRETKEYFGIRSGKEDDGSLVKTFDLGAAELLSKVSRTSAESRLSKGRKKRQEKG